MEQQENPTFACLSLSLGSAQYLFRGPVCEVAAIAFQQAFEECFDYYKYKKINLQIESYGGAFAGMDIMVRNLKHWQLEGKTVALNTQFRCASAAALLLSMGSWGERRVDRGTLLLYHFVRAGNPVSQLTAHQAGHMANSMEDLDQRMLDGLIDTLMANVGGADALLDCIRQRLSLLETRWADVCKALPPNRRSREEKSLPKWLRSLKALSKPGLPTKRALGMYEKHLVTRFKEDSPMDLREAYALCLIDQIDQIIGPKAVLLPSCVNRPTMLPEESDDEQEGEVRPQGWELPQLH